MIIVKLLLSMRNNKSGTSLIEVLLALFIVSLALTFSTYMFSFLHRERRIQMQEREVILLAQQYSEAFFRLSYQERLELADEPLKIHDHREEPLPDYVRMEFIPMEKDGVRYLVLQAYHESIDIQRNIIEVPLYVE